jgi:sperm-associated antigen 16 protein
MHAINHAMFSLKGTSFASCDAEGVVKTWDLRMLAEIQSFNTGPHSANKLAYDPCGNVLAVASNDGSVKVLSLLDKAKSREIRAHEDSTQTLLFDRTAEYMVAGGSGMSNLN